MCVPANCRKLFTKLPQESNASQCGSNITVVTHASLLTLGADRCACAGRRIGTAMTRTVRRRNGTCGLAVVCVQLVNPYGFGHAYGVGVWVLRWGSRARVGAEAGVGTFCVQAHIHCLQYNFDAHTHARTYTHARTHAQASLRHCGVPVSGAAAAATGGVHHNSLLDPRYVRTCVRRKVDTCAQDSCV
jgi:hypothetical protein